MMIIGSLNTYTKNLKMQTQFQMKQSQGELQSHKTLEDYLNTSLSSTEGMNHRGDDKLRNIQNKVLAGSKLTAEERKYLQEKDPETYNKLKQAEQEQKAFEQKLRQCKTKEEAQRLKMTYVNASLARVKEVEHNSTIPLSKKLEIAMQEKVRCDKIEESARKFVQSGEYDKLPTEAEEAKAEKDAKEAAEAERTQKHEADEAQKEKRIQKAREDRLSAEEKPSGIHVESREERKVNHARRKARRSGSSDFSAVIGSTQTFGPAPSFSQAAGAYQAASQTGGIPDAPSGTGVDVSA